jgi:RNaseH domain of pPIWI_RE
MNEPHRTPGQHQWPSSETPQAPGTKATTASDPELWAALVHQLRRAPDYRDTLALPLQMHLAKLTEEYVLPHDPDAD